MVKQIPPDLRLNLDAQVQERGEDLVLKFDLFGETHILRFDAEKLAERAAKRAREAKISRLTPKPTPLPFEIVKRLCDDSGVLLPGAEEWIYETYMRRWDDWGHPDDLARELRRKSPPLFPLEKEKVGIRNRKTVIGWGFLELLSEEGLKDPVGASKKIAWSIFRQQYGE